MRELQKDRPAEPVLFELSQLQQLVAAGRVKVVGW
jgi:hypothetical protein